MSIERDELYHQLFTTALEGGIGYWSVATSYHWQDKSTPVDKNGYHTGEDLKGFYADIIEFSENEDDYEAPENPRYRVDRSVIARGLRLIADKKHDIKYLGTDIRKRLARMYWDADDADYDAGDADIIVQVGLFRDEVRYG